MSSNIAKVQLSDTINYQRNRINEIVDEVNQSTGSSIIIVETEADLPSAAAALSNTYIIKNHTVEKGAVFACIVNGVYKYVPLKSDPMNANTFIYVSGLNLGQGVVANKCVYLDSGGIWQLADSTDPSKYAVGIVGTNSGFIILNGTYYNSSLNLTTGSTYYYDNSGNLTVTETNGVAGAAINNKTLSVHFQRPVQVQPDWNQSDSTADDFIKNKPVNVSKSKYGFVPQLPDENTVTKFFRQDGTWSVPNVASVGNPGYCPTLPSDANASKKYLTGAGTWFQPIVILDEEQDTGQDGVLYGVIEEY